jgi:ABC-type nitrate/sulfonate/bicarbonate transport system substrate-binding protein
MRSGRFVAVALAALVVLAGLLAACDEDDNGDLREVTFMAGFRPQASLPFVAVYMADAKGYFADEGLSVTIRHSTQGEQLQLLLAGEIDFTTATGAQVLRRRATEIPIRAVALFGQRGDQGFVARADSGIEGPSDFAGRSVGFKAGVVPAELLALLATEGLDEDDVNLQAVGFDERVFIEGEVEVFPVFLSNEPDSIRKAGVPINVFDPGDYGIATLGLTYIARDETVEEDGELVEAFLRATMRGAAHAADHVDEAIDVVLIWAEGADPDHQRYLLETDLANAQRADGMGRADLEQWDALQDVLLEFDPAYEGPVDVSTAFDGSFVDGLYNDDGTLR